MRRHLTFANIMSSIAVLLALSTGAAFAAQQINGSQLRNRSVKAVKVVRNSLGGNEINESRLSRVPSAANALSLGGIIASDYGRAQGRFYSFTLSTEIGTSQNYGIDLLGKFIVDCTAGPTTEVMFQNDLTTAVGPAIFTRFNGVTTTLVNTGSIGAGLTNSLITEADTNDSTFARGEIAVGTSTVWFDVVAHNSPDLNNKCTARVFVFRGYTNLD